MTIAGTFGFVGWEVIFIAPLILTLLAAAKLAAFRKGICMGVKEFWKATQELTEEMQETAFGGPLQKIEPLSRSFLMALTLILGIICLILVLLEISK